MSQDAANMGSEGAQPRPIGLVIHNRYQILGVVGRGGLGVVYRVADILYSGANIFALKELSDPAPGARQQFELESRWLQALDHNNIPHVRESFEWDGRRYLVMDFVDGENLEQYLHRLGHPLPEDQALRWMLPICDALQYLHTRKPPLLHRDVKPANIIVTPSGHPVLVDFGIAKAHLPGMNQTLTFVRKAGTEGYAPPEQYAATGMTGPWSDVYALGATLYQLLTGKAPQTAVERITGVSPMARPQALNPLVTTRTDAAIMRALELKPANRYQSVTEFAAQMMEALQATKFAVSAPDVAPLPSQTAQTPAVNSPYISPSAPPVIPPARSPISPSLPPAISRPAGSASGSGGSGGYAPAAPTPSRAASLPSLGAPIPSNLPAMSNGQYAPTPASAPSMAAPMAAPRATVSAASLGAPVAGARSAPRIVSKPAITGARTGAKTGALAAAAPQAGRRGPPLGVLIGVLIVLMVVVAGLAFAAYNNFAPPDRSTPTASVTGYFNALEQQNYSRAWQFDASSRNDPNTQTSFTAALDADDARYGKVMSYTITNSQSDTTGHSDYTVSVTRAKAPNAPLTYAVSVTQYSGPLWLIDSAASQ
ncbi:MAG TPA: protein kinase [Ktedonobacterales bacterium]|nr:protein kinase [Ktedonobacterales bacterium]